MATIQVVELAIDRSKSHNEIVTIRESETDVSAKAIERALYEECEGDVVTKSIRGNRFREFWGRDVDGNEWRVHVESDRTPALYVVESRRPTEHGWTDWRSDEIGENAPRSREECERDVASLPTLGPDWATAQYRVREVR